jgi:hypothetical protein
MSKSNTTFLQVDDISNVFESERQNGFQDFLKFYLKSTSSTRDAGSGGHGAYTLTFLKWL